LTSLSTRFSPTSDSGKTLRSSVSSDSGSFVQSISLNALGSKKASTGARNFSSTSFQGES
jgi:hypothetical protein